MGEGRVTERKIRLFGNPAFYFWEEDMELMRNWDNEEVKDLLMTINRIDLLLKSNTFSYETRYELQSLHRDLIMRINTAE